MTTIAGYPRIRIRRRAYVVFVPAVLYPFPHVAQHVMETKGVRSEFTHRRSLIVTVIAIVRRPIKLVHPLTRPVMNIREPTSLIRVSTPEAWSARICPRCILPFRFARQAVGISRLVAQPRRICLGVIIVYVHYWVVVRLRVAR